MSISCISVRTRSVVLGLLLAVGNCSSVYTPPHTHTHPTPPPAKSSGSACVYMTLYKYCTITAILLLQNCFKNVFYNARSPRHKSETDAAYRPSITPVRYDRQFLSVNDAATSPIHLLTRPISLKPRNQNTSTDRGGRAAGHMHLRPVDCNCRRIHKPNNRVRARRRSKQAMKRRRGAHKPICAPIARRVGQSNKMPRGPRGARPIRAWPPRTEPGATRGHVAAAHSSRSRRKPDDCRIACARAAVRR